MNRLLVVISLALLMTACGARHHVVITGNKVVRDRVLVAEASRMLDSWQRSGRPADLSDAAYSMEQYIRSLGHAHAQVRFRQETVGGRLRAVFEVSEGPPVRIGAIHFPGRQALRHNLLADEILAGAQLFGFAERRFVLDDVESAMGRIEQRYLLSGHLRVQTGPLRLEWNEARTEVAVIIPIREGPHYTVTAVDVDLPELPPELVAAIERITQQLIGSAYHERLAREAAAQIRAMLLDRGHLKAAVDGEAHVDDADAIARLRLRVRPGPRHTLRAIEVEGAERTRTTFVRRRFRPLDGGDLMSRTEIDAGVQALYGTGLFSSVTTTTTVVADSPDEVVADLQVNLKELPARRIDIRAGYGSYELVRGGITFGDDNILGEAIRGEISGNASLRGWNGHVSLLDAYHVGRGRSVSLDLDFTQREEPSFSHRTATAEVGYNWQLSPRYNLRLAHQYRLSEAYAIEAAIPEAERDGFYSTSILSARLRYDTRRPRAIDPERGTLLIGGLAWSAAPLGAEIEFIEYRASASRFLPLTRWAIGALHVGGITRQPIARDTLPIGERLFLGGERDVRSFGEDQLGPSLAGEPLGGLTTVVANAELRLRPWQTLPNLETAVFYDVGAVSDNAWDVDRPLGQAIGGGIRYILPVGPVRLDGAWNPGERFAAKREWAVHLAVGFSF